MFNLAILLFLENEGIGFAGFAFILLVFAILVLMLRAVSLWYFRINDIVKNQETTNELLKKILDNQFVNTK